MIYVISLESVFSQVAPIGGGYTVSATLSESRCISGLQTFRTLTGVLEAAVNPLPSCPSTPPPHA